MKLAPYFVVFIFATTAMTRGDEPARFDGLMVVSQWAQKNDTGEIAAMHGALLMKEGRPEACFDLLQERGKEPELVYLVLFSRKVPRKSDLSSKCSTDDGVSRGDYSLDLAGQALKVSYEYKIDNKAGRVTSRSIKVGDHVWKADGPRVFLADVSGDKLDLIPVEVKIPPAIPSPSADDLKGKLRKGIAAIATDAKAVRDFLEK
jgi:hypothetical protein